MSSKNKQLKTGQKVKRVVIAVIILTAVGQYFE